MTWYVYCPHTGLEIDYEDVEEALNDLNYFNEKLPDHGVHTLREVDTEYREDIDYPWGTDFGDNDTFGDDDDDDD